MTKSHDTLVVAQFGEKANNYVTSAVHAQGPDLDAIRRIAASRRPTRALDLGCGGGHVAFTLSPVAAQVTAYDLSAGMLDAVRTTAQARNLGNIATQAGPAEHLPFADASFDMVVSRYSAHHWQDIEAGLVEARRVLRKDGVAVFVDVAAPDRTLCDTFLQCIELWRDTSHVRDYSKAQWHRYLVDAGFSLKDTTMRRLSLDFESWVARMATPAARVEVIRSLEREISDEVRSYFQIDAAGSLTVDTIEVQAAPQR